MVEPSPLNSMKVKPTLSGGGAPLALCKAMLIYHEPGRDPTDVHVIEDEDPAVSSRCFVSLHEVHEEKSTKRPFIGPGQPLERAQLDALILSLVEKGQTTRELLPSNLLYSDTSFLLWWSPVCRREIYFSTADKEFNRDVNGRKVAYPPLLFKATPSLLYVYALAENARPDAETPVMVAPFCNLYENASMCRGDVKLPSSIAPSTIAAWEAMFYDSRFTHSNLNQKQTAHEGGHNGLWREMLDAESFDAKYLVEAKKTVGDLLK
ncbi:PRTRC system protein B [bacterium]|nr:MAG: PRTRC system protein B [bacterium]